MDRKTLETKKISELRTIAQTLGIENSESLKKSELINSIAGPESTPTKETINLAMEIRNILGDLGYLNLEQK